MRLKQTFVRKRPGYGIPLIACAVGLVALGNPAQAQTGSPIATSSVHFSSGMVGLAPGQTARLNVVNVGPSAPSPLPCVLALAFLDGDGKLLKQMFVLLTPGRAGYIDMTMSNTDAARLQIRGIGYNPLLAPGSAVPQPLSCKLVPTLELFETLTGRTIAILSDFIDPTATPK